MEFGEIKVFAPASVANVACGFDILGFAMQWPGDEVVVRLSAHPGVRIAKITGDQGKLPLDPYTNTGSYAIIQLLKDLKINQGIEIEIHKKMPFGSGLGSSAASAAAAVYGVNLLLELELTKQELLPYAVLGEQCADGAYHADNVAPALIGGMILIRDNQTLDAISLPIPNNLYYAVIHPDLNILTKESRSILSKDICLKQHVAQNGNLGAFITSLFTSDYDLLSRSCCDQIIEPQRASTIPYFYTVRDIALRHNALACSISGSGPSYFALCIGDEIASIVSREMQAFYMDKGINCQAYYGQICKSGAKVIV